MDGLFALTLAINLLTFILTLQSSYELYELFFLSFNTCSNPPLYANLFITVYVCFISFYYEIKTFSQFFVRYILISL